MPWTKIALFSILSLTLITLLLINFIQLFKYKIKLKSKKIVFKSKLHKLNTLILLFFTILILPSLSLPILYSKYYIFPGIYSILGFIVISFWIPIRLCISKDGIGVSNVYGRFLTFVPWSNLSSYNFNARKPNRLFIKTKLNKKVSNTSFDIKLNIKDRNRVTKILNLINLSNS